MKRNSTSHQGLPLALMLTPLLRLPLLLAVTAVAVGLAIGVSVGAWGNKLPYNPSENMQRRNSFFIECLIIGCSKRPIWIQRFCASQNN